MSEGAWARKSKPEIPRFGKSSADAFRGTLGKCDTCSDRSTQPLYPDPWTCIFQKLSGPQGPSWVAAFRTISKAGTARPSRWRIARGFAQSFDLASRKYYGDPGSGRLAVHERHRPGPEKVGPGRGSRGSDASVRTSKLAAHSVVHVLQRSSAKRQGVAMNGIHAGHVRRVEDVQDPIDDMILGD